MPHLILLLQFILLKPANEERIFGKILNYQITLANRLSRALSGRQENPALENFILDQTIKCLADLRRM